MPSREQKPRLHQGRVAIQGPPGRQQSRQFDDNRSIAALEDKRDYFSLESVVQLKRDIRVGREVRADLDEFNQSLEPFKHQEKKLSVSELCEVTGAPDRDHYNLNLAAEFKWRQLQDPQKKIENVPQQKVTPENLKQYEEDRIFDYAKNKTDTKSAISLMQNWIDLRDSVVDGGITSVDQDRQYRILMESFGATGPELYASVMLHIYEREPGLLQKLGHLKSTGLQPSASTDQSWSALAEQQMTMLGKLGYESGSGMASLEDSKILAEGRRYKSEAINLGKGVKIEDLQKQAGLPKVSLDSVCLNASSREWEVLGRTLIFYPQEKDDSYVAVKIAKRGEDLEELYREGGMQRILRIAKQAQSDESLESTARSLGLEVSALRQMNIQSTFPEPVGVFMVQMDQRYSDGAARGVGARGIEKSHAQDINQYPCFVYVTEGYDYFRYLNRSEDPRRTEKGTTAETGMSIEELQAGTASSMHDIFATAGEGWMFTQLIDLYHHNAAAERQQSGAAKTEFLRRGDERLADGGGRFLVLLDMMRKVSRDRGGDMNKTWGMGRVDNIWSAVAYPNVRRTGAADVGDAKSQKALLGKVKELHDYLETMKRDFPDLFGRMNNPFKEAFSPEVLSRLRESSRLGEAKKIGFLKPDLELADEVGQAMRRFDQVVDETCEAKKVPNRNEHGFDTREIEKAVVKGETWTAPGMETARNELRDRLMGTCGLDPGNKHQLELVNNQYAALYQGENPEQNAAREKAADTLAAVAKSKAHREQVEQHDLFKDVRHLLWAAEQPAATVAPTVIAAYLSEYLISHLLLTGTYFCQRNTKIGAAVRSEIMKGRDAPEEATPHLQALQQTMLIGCAQAVVGFCGLPQSEVKGMQKIVLGMIDFPMLTRQMAFFMTDAYADVLLSYEYLIDEKFYEQLQLWRRDETKTDLYDRLASMMDEFYLKELVKFGVFDKDDRVALDDDEHRMRRSYLNASWDKKKMKPTDAETAPGYGPDLGTYNGQMPIKEFEALAYRLVPYLMFKRRATRSKGV